MKELSIVKKDLSYDVAVEMSKRYEDIQHVINMLSLDTRVEDVVDENDNKIGQRTHLHPQLLKWMTEARHLITDMWKMCGGEIKQEEEKEKIKIKGRLIMEIIGKSKKEREQILEKWKQTTSFKR